MCTPSIFCTRYCSFHFRTLEEGRRGKHWCSSAVSALLGRPGEGNRTVSSLTGKSCHSLAERRSGFPLRRKKKKKNREGLRLLPSHRLLAAKSRIRTGSRMCVCVRVCVRSHASRHPQTDSCKQSNSGECLCLNTECEQLLDW